MWNKKYDPLSQIFLKKQKDKENWDMRGQSSNKYVSASQSPESFIFLPAIRGRM